MNSNRFTEKAQEAIAASHKLVGENNNNQLEPELLLLAQEGFDPVYGARPLKRTIQRKVLDPLAMKVPRGELQPGDTVLVDAANGQITFQRQDAPVAA